MSETVRDEALDGTLQLGSQRQEAQVNSVSAAPMRTKQL